MAEEETKKAETKAEPKTEPDGTVQPTAEAVKVAKEDAEWRLKNPNEARAREAQSGVGGESFAYLGDG